MQKSTKAAVLKFANTHYPHYEQLLPSASKIEKMAKKLKKNQYFGEISKPFQV
jgi:hypothetical protein